MRAVVVYESMYGNTHLIADAVAEGLRTAMDAEVVPVRDATTALANSTDLLIVGGPTHVHGMSRASTRQAAADAAAKPDSDLTVDPDADELGLRDWFDGLDKIGLPAAAFDTRLDAPTPITGRASKGIAKRLRQAGCKLVTHPESFMVSKETQLEPEEEARARRWGERLAGGVVAQQATTRSQT